MEEAQHDPDVYNVYNVSWVPVEHRQCLHRRPVSLDGTEEKAHSWLVLNTRLIKRVPAPTNNLSIDSCCDHKETALRANKRGLIQRSRYTNDWFRSPHNSNCVSRGAIR